MKLQATFGMIIICVALGALIGWLTDGRWSDPKPSQAAVDSIARAESAAKIDRDNQAASNNERVKLVLLAGVSMAALALVTPLSVQLTAKGLASWHRRRDRQPDDLGRFALLPVAEAAGMFNPNIGMALGAAVSEQAMLEMARIRGAVDMSAAVFANGIEARQVRERQRDATNHGYAITNPNAANGSALNQLDVIDAEFGAPRQHYITDATGATKTIDADMGAPPTPPTPIRTTSPAPAHATKTETFAATQQTPPAPPATTPRARVIGV